MSKKSKCVRFYPEDLNPCPKCGGKVYYSSAPFPNESYPTIECECGLETYLEKNEKILKLKWNCKEQQAEMIINQCSH